MKNQIPSLLATSVAIGLASCAVYADAEFGDNIPTDTVLKLYSPNREDVAIYSDLAGIFSSIELPAGFSVLGTLDMDSFERVVLETSLGKTVAQNAMLAAFREAGWVPLPAAPMALYPSNPDYQQPIEVCMDSYGVGSILFSERSDRNLVALTITDYQQKRDCEFHIETRNFAATRSQSNSAANAMRPYIPRLEITGQSPARGFGHGYSVRGNNGITRRTINSGFSATDIYREAAEQLLAADWALESESFGTSSAAGNWRKAEDGLELSGFLTVVRSETSHYELEFEVIFPETFTLNQNQ